VQTRRAARYLFVLGALGTGIFACLLLVRFTSPISSGTYDKIEIGMPLSQVIELIGLPPGDYSSGEKVVAHFTEMRIHHEMKREELEWDLVAYSPRIAVLGPRPQLNPKFGRLVGWEVDSAILVVYLDDTEKVQQKAFLPSHRLKQ